MATSRDTSVVELVAHRGGNHPGSATGASAVADIVEVDVHWHRGRLEVRHAKRLWGTQRLWDRWYVLPRDTPRPTLGDVIAAAGPDAHLMIDMKGWSPRLATAVRSAIAGRAHTTVTTKAWWLLRHFSSEPTVRTLRSAGTRARLVAVQLMPSAGSVHGVVVHERLLTRAAVRRLSGRGQLFTWAVADHRRAAELAEWGVTGIIVDDLTLITDLRSARVQQPPQQL